VRAEEAAAETFTHHVTPAGIIGAAGVLYGRAPRALLFTMTAESFDVSEALSATVTEALPGMARAARDAARAALGQQGDHTRRPARAFGDLDRQRE
jgi:hypothetical protein